MLRYLRRTWWAIAAAALLAPAFLFGLTLWRATGARDRAAAEIRTSSECPFRVVPLTAAAPSGVEPIAAAPDFQDAVAFSDGVAVSARGGLYLYDRNGALAHAYRAGIELPPAELGAMGAGVTVGSAQPELFVATRGEGLLVFDGSRFRQILPEDARLRTVTAVQVLNSGRVLLGSEHFGVLVWDGHRLTPFHGGLKDAHITALAGNDGDLWIGTLERGLLHYRGGELDDLEGALPDRQVLSIFAAGDAAYAGTPLGVVEFRDGKRTRTLADGFFARAVAVRGDTLYVGTQDEGAVAIPLQSHSLPANRAADDVPATRRLVNLEGEIYAVVENALLRYDAADHSWRPALSGGPAVLTDRNVAALGFSGGRLWVGYFDRGLDVVDPSFDRAVHQETDSLFCVNRIVAAPDGRRTAVATANGLVLFDAAGRPRQVMGRKDGLLSDHVTDVLFRDSGMVVATPAGLSFIDAGGIRSLYVFHGLVNNHVYTVAASGSRIAAGTLGGLSLLDDDTVRANYTTANSRLKHNWITALARVGDEWFAGTYGAGVLRLDASGEWHSFADLKEGFVVNPKAMAATPGRVYAGSLDHGLFVYDRASGRWANTTTGLPSKNVTAMAADGGYLYIGADNGLVRIAEGALR